MANEHASDSSLSETLDGVQATLNQSLNHSFSPSNSNSKQQQQQRIQLKRPYDEMSILRSLCNENYTAEEESVSRKRSRVSAVDENEQRIRHKTTKGRTQHQQNINKDLAEEVVGGSKTATAVDEELKESFFDENSPNRHHPLNHRPPAMEARFLECMAAIALHSNIPLPIDDENLSRCGSVDSGERGESGSDDKGKIANGTTKDTDSGDSKNSNNTELKSTSPCRPESSEKLANSNGNEACFDKKWPNSAIDEELCQELENYKNSDVPVIHAFVLPPKLQHSGSSANPGEKSTDDTTYTVASSSVAVPIPILNILLDRILQTMLDS